MLDENLIRNLQRGEALACEIKASSADRRSWIAIYPHTKRRDFRPVGQQTIYYRLRWFEVPVSDLEEREYNLDGDESFIVTCRDETVDSLDKVDSLLSAWQISTTSFSFINTSDYPI